MRVAALFAPVHAGVLPPGFLLEFREQLEISQEELAHRAGIHRTYIGDLERGARNPALVNICRIAKALDTKPSGLFKMMRM